MKKIAPLSLFLSLFLLSCCGADTPVEPEAPIPQIEEIAENVVPEVEIPADTHPEIIWGLNQFSFPQPIRVGANSTFAAGSVIDYFNARLDTGFKIKQYTFSPVNDFNSFDKEFAKMPDIFITDPMSVQGTSSVTYLNPQEVYDADFTRTIPRAMIETYAPRYASLLTMHNAWDINQTENGDFIGLSTFAEDTDYLPMFSLYNLDWLEEMGISPKGSVTDLGNGIYFTEEAFNENEFFNIINSFTADDKSGLFIKIENVLTSVAPLLGMYGVNSSVIEEEGKAVPYYISSAYKNALMHIQNMLNRESVTVFANGRYDNPRTFVDTLHTVAWRCVPSVSAYSHALSLRQHDFIKKVLITPPEAGPDGTRGVGPTRPEHPFTPIRSWMVRIDVSDEKLAQILTLFDAMSFDPETYISARYGQEGTDYSWEGAPYASAVNEVYRSAPAIKITTDVILNDVVKPLYAFGSGVLLEYAENNGEWQPVPNYNQAVWGDRANEKYLIDGRIGEDIDNTVSRYLSDVLLDRKNLEDDWNAYIEKLNELGVEAYVEYYNGE